MWPATADKTHHSATANAARPSERYRSGGGEVTRTTTAPTMQTSSAMAIERDMRQEGARMGPLRHVSLGGRRLAVAARLDETSNHAVRAYESACTDRAPRMAALGAPDGVVGVLRGMGGHWAVLCSPRPAPVNVPPLSASLAARGSRLGSSRPRVYHPRRGRP